MFDAEEVSICLNSFYEAGIQDDMLALIYEANKSNVISVKTPSGNTKKATISNKIMQGDVLSPLVSSNTVDRHISKVAKEAGHIYMYKDKVEIPPLTMQDDTLGISVCGFRSKQMNMFLNTRTNIMNLQFGSDKCDKMHIGKQHKKYICPALSVDSWKEVLEENDKNQKILKDSYDGKKEMKDVLEKKYLGDIISSDGKNKKNIKDRTNKATGNVNKIVTTLNERYYGKNTFKAYKLMREGILLGSLLTNSESWINVTNQDISELEKPDTHLLRKVLDSSASKCFMMLELGIIPVRFVLMKKRLQFLHYILNESTSTMLRQVYDTLKEESRHGDFVSLTQSDKNALNIDILEEDIQLVSKWSWKKYLTEKVREAAFLYLTQENSSKEKTKNITFENLNMSKYLWENENRGLSQTIFSIRSQTLDIKEWQPWKYLDNLCVKCELYAETMDHFVVCKAYGIETEKSWKDIFENNVERQKEIGRFIKQRHKRRQESIDEKEAGQTSVPAPLLQRESTRIAI